MQRNIAQLIQQNHKILPIINIEGELLDDEQLIIPTIAALQEAGVAAIEITLRNRQSFSALKNVRKNFPSLWIAAGTVTRAQDIAPLTELNLNAIITPGINRTLINTCQQHSMDILPGVATPSDILLGLEFNLQFFKFFPAEALGGVAMLNALKGPFADIQFCATGGINEHNIKHYLALDNVFSVGSSSIVSDQDIQKSNWTAITQKVKALTEIANTL